MMNRFCFIGPFKNFKGRSHVTVNKYNICKQYMKTMCKLNLKYLINKVYKKACDIMITI